MAEKDLVIDGLEIDYEGLFSVKDLLEKIDELLKEKGYAKAEKRRHEKTNESSRELYIELRPAKRKSVEQVLMINIRLDLKDIKEAEVKVDNIPQMYEHGKVNIIIDAWSITDFEAKWEQNPYLLFLRSLYSKFIKNISDRSYSELTDDTHFLYNNIQAFLKLHEFKR